MHTGVRHEQIEGGIFCHQFAYVEQLHPLAVGHLKGHIETELVDDVLRSQFHSLLGGVAWTVLTRAEVAIYVQALQRRASSARVCVIADASTLC